ncbi:hypothetical protein HYU17_00085 [Candidatus Woesearchaeota archaeon]|nr:hypothetical protein [Candidatus Woesearchaeota archaeon]
MLQENQFRREVAHKTSAAEILNAAFQQDDTGSMALNLDGRLAKRVNLLATVISKSEDEGQARKSMIVDDGTARLRLRFFDDNGLFRMAEVGGFATIIGRPRSYDGEAYIAPEIIKPNNNIKWAEVRRLELELARRTKQHAGQPSVSKEAMAAPAAGSAGKAASENSEDAVSGEKVELYSLIKRLDTGRGADIGEVAARSGMKDANRILDEMMKKGDVFEVLPGRLKVLE